jgi:hypothetical protein
MNKLVRSTGAGMPAVGQRSGDWVWDGSNWVCNPDCGDDSSFPPFGPPVFSGPTQQPPWYPGANGGVSFGAVAPPNPVRGHFWWNGTLLQLFDGAAWVTIGPTAGGTPGGGGTNVGPTAIRLFTIGTVYNVPLTLVRAVVELIGGGGGGGGNGGGSGYNSGGGGGGSGGYSRRLLTAAQMAPSQLITIGAGGTAGGPATNGGNGGASSFGSLVVANGGGGGKFSSAGNIQVGGGGAGAVVTGAVGDLVAGGDPGGQGYWATGFDGDSGEGGSSIFGGGANGASFMVANMDGIAATNYGSGGSGGALSGVGSQNGGLGAAGVCVVTEY